MYIQCILKMLSSPVPLHLHGIIAGHSGRLVAQGAGGFGGCAEPLVQAPLVPPNRGNASKMCLDGDGATKIWFGVTLLFRSSLAIPRKNPSRKLKLFRWTWAN